MSMPSPMSMPVPIMPSVTRINGKHGLHSNDDDDSSNDYTNDLRLQSLAVLFQVIELRNQLSKLSYTYLKIYLIIKIF